jgi:hypothetical protein
MKCQPTADPTREHDEARETAARRAHATGWKQDAERSAIQTISAMCARIPAPPARQSVRAATVSPRRVRFQGSGRLHQQSSAPPVADIRCLPTHAHPAAASRRRLLRSRVVGRPTAIDHCRSQLATMPGAHRGGGHLGEILQDVRAAEPARPSPRHETPVVHSQPCASARGVPAGPVPNRLPDPAQIGGEAITRPQRVIVAINGHHLSSVRRATL